MPFTWTDNVGVPNTPCEPQKLADDLMHLKYDMLTGTSTDNAIVKFDGEYGKLQNSLALIDDEGNITTPAGTLSPYMGGYKNKVINGNFDIWQRGTSQTATMYGSDDRWLNASNGSTKDHSQQTFPLGQTDVPGNPEFFSRTVVSSVAGASSYVIKTQYIENVRTLAGQTATLSFWAKADSNKNIALSFQQYFGSGGSPTVYFAQQLIPLTTLWQKKTITVQIPSIAGKIIGTAAHLLGVTFWFDAGSSFSNAASLGQQSGTFDLAQIQLEEGSVATPFESRYIAQELALCQRYYFKTFPLTTAPAQNTGIISGALTGLSVSTLAYTLAGQYILPVAMRANPTVLTFNPSAADSGWCAAGTGNYPAHQSMISATSVYLRNAGTLPGVNAGYYIHFTADAEL